MHGETRQQIKAGKVDPGRSSDPRYSPSSQTTSQNHYALRELNCMQTTQQYTVSQK